jgi:hypothetical protein
MCAKVRVPWRGLGAPTDEGEDQPKNACQEHVDVAKPAALSPATAYP